MKDFTGRKKKFTEAQRSFQIVTRSQQLSCWFCPFLAIDQHVVYFQCFNKSGITKSPPSHLPLGNVGWNICSYQPRLTPTTDL